VQSLKSIIYYTTPSIFIILIMNSNFQRMIELLTCQLFSERIEITQFAAVLNRNIL